MTEEHRLTFDLYRSTDLELEALKSVQEKAVISKRCHEYIRRLMAQGLLLRKVLARAQHSIADIQRAVDARGHSRGGVEFKCRFNVDCQPSGADIAPEEEIWRTVSTISNRVRRRSYLRELFLYGYWLESLPRRDVSVVQQLISPAHVVEPTQMVEQVLPEKKSAKLQLGGLMP